LIETGQNNPDAGRNTRGPKFLRIPGDHL
jgi:hypothetical protein